MLYAELQVKRKYGYRERPRARGPLLCVELIEKVGRKGIVKVRFLDGPHPGLEEYVKSQQLVVKWGDQRKFLRDEDRLDALKKASAAQADGARVGAVDTVVEALGYPEAALGSNGVLSLAVDELERLMSRAGMDRAPDDLHPLAFTDRNKIVHIPYDGAEVLAKRLAACEPDSVELYIADLEAQYKARGLNPGDRFHHDFLREQMPGFAIARSWAGAQRTDLLFEEVERLRRLIMKAVWDFEGLGEKQKADQLRRGLDGG